MQAAARPRSLGPDVSGVAILLLVPASVAFVFVFALTVAVDLAPLVAQGGHAPWHAPPSVVYRVPAVVTRPAPDIALALSAQSVPEPPAPEPLPAASAADEAADGAVESAQEVVDAADEDVAPAVPDDG
jgi:hypothetical protein